MKVKNYVTINTEHLEKIEVRAFKGVFYVFGK